MPATPPASTSEEAAEGAGTARPRFAASCTAGGALASVVFAWLVIGPGGKPFASEALGDFYEGQAAAWLRGAWNVPSSVVLFERFRVGDKFFMYFGPWPAVLRLPFVALTDSLDGRLARASMIVAFVVFIGFGSRLLWQARTVVRGASAPVGAWEAISVAGFIFVAGCGSSILFLGSRAWVYHEAVLWGDAWAMASFSCIVAYVLRGRPASLGWASVTATLAFLSRPSLGSGPLIALMLILLVGLAQQLSNAWLARRATVPRPLWLTRAFAVDSHETSWRRVCTLVGAVALPVIAYMYVNYAKFGALFRLPYGKQDLQLSRPERRAALAATGDSLFSLRYVPTNLLAYFRPDGIGFRTTFPWVTFAPRPRVIGAVTFDNIEPLASVTVASLVIVLLAGVGVAVVFWVRRTEAPRASTASGGDRAGSNATPAAFRVVVIGAILGTAGTFAIADLFERYTGDFVPGLVIAAAVGLSWLTARSVRHRWTRYLGAAFLVVAALWSCWVTLGLSLIYQREYTPLQSASVRGEFLDFQLDVNHAIGAPYPVPRTGARLPTRKSKLEGLRTSAPHGTLFVVGDCEALYVSSGREWAAIEQKFPGQAQWAVTFDRLPAGARSPLWSTGAVPDDVVWARWVDRHHVRLEQDSGVPGASPVAVSRAFRVRSGREYRFDVRRDPLSGSVDIGPEGSLPFGEVPMLIVLKPRDPAAGAATPQLGGQPDEALGATRFAGAVRSISVTPQCDRLAVAAANG